MSISSEFSESSKEGSVSFYELPCTALRRLVEKATSSQLIEEIIEIALDRAIKNEFDIEANELCIFALERQKQLAHIEEQHFYAVSAHFYMKDSPQIEADEEARIALFKK